MATEEDIVLTSLMATSSLVCTLAPAEKGPTPHVLSTVQAEFGKIH